MKPMLLSALLVVPLLADTAEIDKRLSASATVLDEIMRAKDNSIPQNLLAKARCVGVIPGMKKAGFIVGGKYGKGAIVCRSTTSTTGWSAPNMVRIEGGSFGLQIGGGETDIVMLIMNEKGENSLLKDKFTMGGDASVMAGPVGRSAEAQTDATLKAEILAYSRSRGAFAGVSLDGSTLRPDSGDNKALYGKEVTPQEILHGKVKPPA